MLLCLDVGNSNIVLGIFKQNVVHCMVRYATDVATSAQEHSHCFKTFLSDHAIKIEDITQLAMVSVVPAVQPALLAACAQVFHKPVFNLRVDASLGLSIAYDVPTTLGVDRVANLLAASVFYPDENCIVVDMGTATTFCALTQERCFLGGAILPGMQLITTALHERISVLPKVDSILPTSVVAKATAPGLQAGLYYGYLGALKEIIARMKMEVFSGQSARVIATGGLAAVFENEAIFDDLKIDLTLQGLRIALQKQVAPKSNDL